MSKPYVYIIEFKELGKRYIGVRYAKGCDKAELLQPGGYFTSSRVVHELLSQGHIATIVEIIEFDTAKQAVAEEARLIKEGFEIEPMCMLNRFSPEERMFYVEPEQHSKTIKTLWKEGAYDSVPEFTKIRWANTDKELVSQARRDDWARGCHDGHGDKIRDAIARGAYDNMPQKMSDLKKEKFSNGEYDHVRRAQSESNKRRWQNGSMENLRIFNKDKVAVRCIFTEWSGQTTKDDPMYKITKIPCRTKFLKDPAALAEVKRNVALLLLTNEDTSSMDIGKLCLFVDKETGKKGMFVDGYAPPNMVKCK